MIKIGPCDYNAGAPEGYVCGDCEAHGVKLWRDPDAFVALPRLRCAWCAEKHQRAIRGRDWRRDPTFDGDHIGALLPATPTEDGSTFWGYTSAPRAACAWWKRLPESEV